MTVSGNVSMISPDINANTGIEIMGDNAQTSELQKLQDKVRALERQNALLKQNQPIDSVDGAELATTGDNLLQKMAKGNASSSSSAVCERIEDVKLIDIESLEGTEGDWLISMDQEEVENLDDVDWLRRDVENPSAIVAIKKKSLVNKLEDLARSKYFCKLEKSWLSNLNSCLKWLSKHNPRLVGDKANLFL